MLCAGYVKEEKRDRGFQQKCMETSFILGKSRVKYYEGKGEYHDRSIKTGNNRKTVT